MRDDHTELVLVLLLIASICNLVLVVLEFVCAMGGVPC